jgi:F0F1-type ATP synthase assembly protein I
MRHVLALALVVAMPSCTLVGAGAGAGIGHIAGSAGKGAVIGAMIGLRLDVELVKDMRALRRSLIFW